MIETTNKCFVSSNWSWDKNRLWSVLGLGWMTTQNDRKHRKTATDFPNTSRKTLTFEGGEYCNSGCILLNLTVFGFFVAKGVGIRRSIFSLKLCHEVLTVLCYMPGKAIGRSAGWWKSPVKLLGDLCMQTKPMPGLSVLGGSSHLVNG